MIDNDEFSYACPASCFRDIFRLPFAIDVIFTQPQTIGRAVLKIRDASGKDFRLQHLGPGTTEWLDVEHPEVAETTRQSTAAKEDIVELTYRFKPVATGKLRVVLSNRKTVLGEIEAYER